MTRDEIENKIHELLTIMQNSDMEAVIIFRGFNATGDELEYEPVTWCCTDVDEFCISQYSTRKVFAEIKECKRESYEAYMEAMGDVYASELDNGGGEF